MLRMEIRMETEIPTPETQEVLEPTIEDMIQAEDGVPFTTSLAIAQAFEKEHKNVLRDIQNLECSPKFLELNFELYEYSRDLGIGVREYPAYRLTRDVYVVQCGNTYFIKYKNIHNPCDCMFKHTIVWS